MAFTIAKRFSFSASHRLDAMPEGHPCRRLHGHNYEVEVIVSADETDDRGMVVDYLDLSAVKEFIDTHLDHKHLNDVLLLKQPTAEVLARWIYEQVPMYLTAVRVSETPRTWAEYRP